MCHVTISNTLLIIFYYLYTELCVGMIKTTEIDDGIERIRPPYIAPVNMFCSSRFSLPPSLYPCI